MIGVQAASNICKKEDAAKNSRLLADENYMNSSPPHTQKEDFTFVKHGGLWIREFTA